MGASQEIRYRIAGDTKSLKAEFNSIPSAAQTAGQKAGDAFDRAFKRATGRTIAEAKASYAMRTGAASAASGGNGAGRSNGGDVDSGSKSQWGQFAFRAIGGAIAFGIQRVTAWNESRVRVDEAKAEAGAVGLASLRSTFASIGGLKGQLTQGRGSIKDMESERDMAQKRADFLNSGAQEVVSKVSPGELMKAEESVARLNGQIQQQHNTNQLIERDLDRQRMIRDAMLSRESKFAQTNGLVNGVRKIGDMIVGKEIGAIPETERASRGGTLNDITKAKIELRRLIAVQKAEENKGTPEAARDAKAAVRLQKLELANSKRQMGVRLLDVNQELTGQAAEGRTFANGRARPLSETERLARRAQQYRERARNAVLTGAGQSAAEYTDSAINLESAVGNRISAASSDVARRDVTDSAGLKPELTHANQLLEAIKNSLAVENYD